MLQQCKGYFYDGQYDIGNIILFVIVVGIDLALRAGVSMVE